MTVLEGCHCYNDKFLSPCLMFFKFRTSPSILFDGNLLFSSFFSDRAFLSRLLVFDDCWLLLLYPSQFILFPCFINGFLLLAYVVKRHLGLLFISRWQRVGLADQCSRRISNVVAFVRRLLFVPLFSGWGNSKWAFLFYWQLLSLALVVDTLWFIGFGMVWRLLTVWRRRRKNLIDGFRNQGLLVVGRYIAGAHPMILVTQCFESDLVIGSGPEHVTQLLFL